MAKRKIARKVAFTLLFYNSHLMLLNVFAKTALYLVKETTEGFSLCISSNSVLYVFCLFNTGFAHAWKAVEF